MQINQSKSTQSSTEKKEDKSVKIPVTENLGLDADQSSEDSGINTSLNNDNDRISHNPDGEDDDQDTTEIPGHSPLMDK